MDKSQSENRSFSPFHTLTESEAEVWVQGALAERIGGKCSLKVSVENLRYVAAIDTDVRRYSGCSILGDRTEEGRLSAIRWAVSQAAHDNGMTCLGIYDVSGKAHGFSRGSMSAAANKEASGSRPSRPSDFARNQKRSLGWVTQ